jgi:hypothetical protein
MHRDYTEAERIRRKKIVDELQERIRLLRAEIQLQEYKKQSAIEEHDRYILEYQDDLEFNLTLLHEFGAREEDAYTDDEEEQEQVSVQEATVAVARATADTQTITKAERQEAKDKARAWHLDRTREKEQKQKQKQRR